MALTITVDKRLVASIVSALVAATKGPGEAFAVLVAAIVLVNDINKDATGIDISIEKLAEEAKLAILSLHEAPHVEH